MPSPPGLTSAIPPRRPRPGRKERSGGNEARPTPGAPFVGIHPDWIADGERCIVSAARGCMAAGTAFREPQGLRLAAPSMTSPSSSPLGFLVVQQLRLGRRHYHIALRGSRHLTAGTREPGGRPAVKSISGRSIERLCGAAARGAPSGPSTNERLRRGPERPPAPGGPRGSPCRGRGPGTTPVRRGRHFALL